MFYLSKKILSYKFNSDCRGFTIVEMLVVIGIFFIITGIVLVNAPQFRERVSIDLVANDLALVIRSAQTYGMATRESKVSSPGTFPSYGFYLQLNEDSISDIFIYPLLEGVVPSGEDLVVEEEYNLAPGFTIESICTRADIEDEVCQNTSSLSIAFIRPALKATICSDNDCENDKAEIIIKSVKEEKTRLVGVYKNGQIAVEK